MKQLLYVSLILSCYASLIARELRTPLIRDDQGYRLMPLPIHKEKPWAIKSWISPFKRTSEKALCSKKGCHQRCGRTCGLSALIFGQSSFTGAEAFSPSSVAQSSTTFNGDGTNRTLSCQPLLSSSVVSPCLKWIDKGVMFGLQIVRYINDCWSVGVRGSVPYRNFTITHPKQCNENKSLFGGQTIKNKLCTKQEVINGVSVRSFAYRMDTLSGLPIGCIIPPQTDFPVVNYYNALFANNAITMSNQNVTDNVALPLNYRNPVSVIQQPTGTKPEGQWGAPLAQAQALPALPGTGQTNDARARFVDSTDYRPLGLDADTQSQLWIVPSVGNGDLVPAALVIRDNIDQLLQTVGLSTEDFFERQCGDCFAPQTKSGVGDTQTEYFVRWRPHDDWYVEGLFGVRFPTGRTIKNPKDIFCWPTGNNGHYEYRLGVHTGIWLSDYLMLNMNSYYTWVAQHEELILAPYKGARIKNIGSPCMPADISWRYYLGHIDLLFMQPYHKGIFGFDIGYELYDKGTDRIRLTQCTATDCLGHEAALSARTLAERTHVISHKLRTTLFYDTREQHPDGAKWAIFGGFDVVLGGSNVPKEHGPHAGVMIMY